MEGRAMFRELPRYVGFPNQVWVDSELGFKNFETMFKNKLPFFVSTFQFKDRNTPIVDNLFFDIDSYYSVRIPWRNVKRLKSWCYKHDIPYVINFSGGKGFHFFILTKPIVPKSNAVKDEIRDLMYSIQMTIAKETGIEAYDEPTFGRLRFLVRYPTSKYIRRDADDGEYTENGFYCRNLTDEEFDAGVKKISKIAKEPGEVPKPPKSDISLKDLIDMLPKYKKMYRSKRKNIGELEEKIFLQRAGVTVPTIDALGLPCLKEIAKHPHPTHFERIELVAWLKYLGYTDMAIISFIKQLNWTRFNYTITSYQVRTIYARDVNCKFLRKSYGHLCNKCIFNSIGKGKRKNTNKEVDKK